MSTTVETQAKPKLARNQTADGYVLAQVEKWMAVIREINREPAKN